MAEGCRSAALPQDSTDLEFLATQLASPSSKNRYQDYRIVCRFLDAPHRGMRGNSDSKTPVIHPQMR